MSSSAHKMGSMSCNSEPYHVVLFPFMSKGHTIPILHLARLLLRRNITITIFTTPANRPFIAKHLADTTASIIELQFPENIPKIPAGVESTDKLPSISLFPPFALATKHMQPDFERAIEILPRVNFMVSDGFLWWTVESATKFNFARLEFYGMSNYSSCVSRVVGEGRLLLGTKTDDELVTATQFPWIRVSRNEFDPVFVDPKPEDPHFELLIEVWKASSISYGCVMNSFYELEPVFVDYWNQYGPYKAWCVGPLCLAQSPKVLEPNNQRTWIQWLDQKLEQGIPVLYVAFGSQAEISLDQLKEIAIGLEESNVNFLWVTRKKESELLGDGFEERVKERGIIVRDWVDQREILMHQSVQGFLSHCGWNSVLESICAGVPILAWPMMAEQPLNAKMVVEEIKVGLRVETSDGSVKGFVKREGLKKMVMELMEGQKGKEVKKKVMEYAQMAIKAMEYGTGSSWRTLNLLIDEICNSTKPL